MSSDFDSATDKNKYENVGEFSSISSEHSQTQADMTSFMTENDTKSTQFSKPNPPKNSKNNSSSFIEIDSDKSKDNSKDKKKTPDQNSEKAKHKDKNPDNSSYSYSYSSTDSEASPTTQKNEQDKPVLKGITPIYTSKFSYNQLAYTTKGWVDCTNESDAMQLVHPILALNFNLKQRSQLLVQLISESEFEIQQTNAQIQEARLIIQQLEDRYDIEHIPVHESEEEDDDSDF